MKSIKFWIERFLVYITLLLLTSCAPSPEYFSSPNEYSKRYLPLEAEDLIKVEEIDSWKIMDEGISLIKYNLLSNQLISVNEPNKKIIVLNVGTKETNIHSILDAPDFRILGIDAKGEKLLGAMSSKNLSDGEGSPAYLEWIAIWDTGTGLQTDCITVPCTEPDNYKSTDLGASMDFDGKTIVVFGEDSYRISGLSSNVSSSVTVNNPDADYWWHIGMIAIDSFGNRLAIAFREGRVTLENIPQADSWPFSRSITVLEKGDENRLEPIYAVLFDRSGNWLAIVRGKQLSIWDVGDWRQKKVYQEDVGALHGISFNPSGTLLFLGTDDKIMVIGLAEKKMVAVFDTPNITSLDISEDNRLLFWGDKSGMIHVWGIPKSN